MDGLWLFNAVTEIQHKWDMTVQWGSDVQSRREKTPWYENFRDALTGTQLLEVSTGLGAMWFDNGQYYDEGPLCGVKMECFTETSFSYGTITLGHTINSGQTNISAGTQVHEYGHVLDVEEATPLIYYPAYGVQAVVSWISDTVSGEDADWHDSNLMEKTSDVDEEIYVRTKVMPGQGFISDFWDEVFG